MSKRAVVLAHTHDVGASAIAARLSSMLGTRNVTMVRPEMLGLARWSHHLGSTSGAQTCLTLPSGTEVHSSDVAVLFNRLHYLPIPRFSTASPKDRDYAGSELQALVASWLYSLGPRVVNPTGPRAQARGPVSQRAWLASAASLGLPVVRRIVATSGRRINDTLPGEQIRLRVPWPGGLRGPVPVDVEQDTASESDGCSLLVAGDRVVGPLTEAFGAQCTAVARRSECTLLEFRFAPVLGKPALLRVDPMPSLAQPWAADAATELLVATAHAHE